MSMPFVTHPPFSRRLADWIVEVPRDWTASGLAAAERAVYDSLLCVLAGAGDLRPVLDALEPGSGPCPVPGRQGLRVARDAAALAWGTAVHKRELDDQTYSLGGHLMCVVLPALLCSQHGKQVAWPDIFDAIVVACEVESQVNRCMTRQHMEQGWVATTTYGVLGAVSAVARLERFTSDQTLAALSLAANKAFGNKNLFGTAAKAVNPGLAARDAVMLARMARQGLAASADPLEGPYGFGVLYRGRAQPDWTALVPDISHPSEPSINTGLAFKKYPCCASSHRCVDALLELREAHDLRPEMVAGVTAYVGPLNLLTLRYPNPGTAGEAMFSMQYILAGALRHGALTPADFSARAVQDPATRALFPLIDMQLLPEASAPGFVETTPLAHRVEVQLRDRAGTLSSTVLHPRGAPLNPFDEADWTLKFDHCTKGILTGAALDRVHRVLGSFSDYGVDELMDELTRFDSPDDPDGERFQR